MLYIEDLARHTLMESDIAMQVTHCRMNHAACVEARVFAIVLVLLLLRMLFFSRKEVVLYSTDF